MSVLGFFLSWQLVDAFRFTCKVVVHLQCGHGLHLATKSPELLTRACCLGDCYRRYPMQHTPQVGAIVLVPTRICVSREYIEISKRRYMDFRVALELSIAKREDEPPASSCLSLLASSALAEIQSIKEL